MARYFFNLHDGRSIIDDQGSDLDGLAEVRIEALRTAGDLLKNGGHADLWSGEEWRLVVNDETGREVLALRFSAEGSVRPDAANSN